ncbi:thioredoxin domain-containing protein [Microbacterium schleiferi]|uniref:Thioredoxin domain-containing protein n=1 Tax=Microbacterium schleiferi TaxID=69362 RepID=A0A7S8MXV1_9MICO|nr:thioredoxin domain-containing protein [Microbacterium schleiferi]QPE04928.1 thioredoxin domain-containing protein [Microbacterium schleiferi]
MATTANRSNSFAIWVSVAVVAALVLVGALVVWMNNSNSASGPVPAAANVNTETGAIAVGAGPNTVDTYVDFMCPYCNQFEQAEGETIKRLIDDGSITLNVHPVSILDRISKGTEFSTRSASAAYCVAESDPDVVLDFVSAMYAHQPAEDSPGLRDDEIVAIAESAGATNSSSCITNGTYMDFATQMTKNLPADPATGRAGTPALVVNGEYVPLKPPYNPQADIVSRLN